MFAGEVRWRLDWKGKKKTKPVQTEQRKMNEPLKCSQLFSILWQTVTNDGWNKIETRGGEAAVSLQAANKEEMYYHALISHKQPLLWLFPRCVRVKRDFVSCPLQHISLYFKIKMNDLFISSHNQNLTCVWAASAHVYVAFAIFSSGPIYPSWWYFSSDP